MSDILNIRVTAQELNLIMDLLHEAGDRTDSNGQPAFELCHDLMEQSGDVVDDDLDPTDLNGRTFSVAESDFIDHGIRAREMQKHTSMAANRRTMRFGEFTVDEPRTRTEHQSVDVWDANDPKNW